MTAKKSRAKAKATPKDEGKKMSQIDAALAMLAKPIGRSTLWRTGELKRRGVAG